MQSLEATSYEVRVSENNEFVIIIPFVNKKEYFSDLESIKFVVENNILSVGYYKENDLKRRLTFSDLPSSTISMLIKQEKIIICEIYQEEQVFYDAQNFDYL